MKKILPIYILLIVLSITSKAQQQVSISTARTAAITTMKYNQLIYSEEDINTVNLYISERDTILYEVKFKDNHSVLLSGSLACQPVLGYNFSYADETVLDHFDEIPPGLQSIVQEYIDQIELCFANDTITLWHEKDWEDLMKYSKDGNEVYDVVSPLITTKWGQSKSNDNLDCNAYNYYVTETNNSCTCSDKHCPTGCVATAMAQIMNYWKHPVYHPLYGPNQFDWCNMPDSLLSYHTNYAKERNAVAWLMRQCGLQVDMDYCHNDECASGATIPKAKKALIKHFGYSDGANIKRKRYHNDQWDDFVKDDLDLGKPLLYSGDNEESGHAFVCDGYRSDNSFHFNWGWNGAYNQYWFSLSPLSLGAINYNSDQMAIFNIHPSSIVDYCHFSASLETYFRIYSEYSPNPSIAAPKIFDTLVSVSRSSDLDARYRTIPVGESIEYVAHKKVKLVDGFHAEEGSHFVSYIDECEACEEGNKGHESIADTESYFEEATTEIQQTNENEINIIPNPNNGSFYILLSNNEHEIPSVRVIDFMGKTVYSNNRFKGGEVVLPNAKQGLYYVVVTLKDVTITKKMVIL